MNFQVRDSLFDRTQILLEESLNHRLNKQNVIASNVTNASTPGYLALDYSFENQFQKVIDDTSQMKTSSPLHIKNPDFPLHHSTMANLYIKPQESIGNDGNTVDIDKEMIELAQNQLFYRTTVESLNRNLAMLRYAINGGRS